MQNKKSPGNDGLTTEVYQDFWDEIKKMLITSATEAKRWGAKSKKQSISQRQAIIRLIEKNDWDKKKIH